MDIEEARKKVQQLRKPSPYIQINISYDKFLIMPFKEGMQFLEALKATEMYTKSYANPPKIKAVTAEDFVVNLLSAEEYEQIHMAQLMQVTLESLKNPSPF